MQKKLGTMGTFIVALIIIAWGYLFPSKQTDKTTSKSTEQPVLVEKNYDYIMRNDSIGQNANAPVDYYMLVLSWSPSFCEGQRKKYGKNLPTHLQQQCGSTQFGWVIHGLWPQNASAKSISQHPRFCQGDLPMLSAEVISPYLLESPSASLLQGEWEKHGACAFQQAEDYFKKQQELYRTLTLPTEELSRNALFQWLRQHNPQLKNAYLRANHNELFICYDRRWQVMDCPRN